MAKSRLISDYPVIGIRPTIDGRRGPLKVRESLEVQTMNMADLGYFRGSGFSSRFETTATMPATVIRLNLVKGLGPVLQIAEGWTVALPADVSDALWKRTDYRACASYGPLYKSYK